MMVGAKQDAQVLYSALTFRCLLDALARPGKINQLAYPHFPGDLPSYSVQATSTDVKINAYALGAMLTLLDRETSFAIATNGRWLAQNDLAVQWVGLRSGASVAIAGQAAFALFCDDCSAELITGLSVGTLLEPETSTTAICCVEQLAQSREALQPYNFRASNGLPAISAPADHERRLTLELRGPGIKVTHEVSVLGLSEAYLKAMLAVRRSYPLGIDVYLVDASGHCVGLPRTTRIDVVAHGA